MNAADATANDRNSRCICCVRDFALETPL